MSAPRLTSLGRITAIGGGRIYVDSLPTPADEGFAFDVSADVERAYSPMLYVDGAVRITIEPDGAVTEPAPHGTALDYLAELTGLLTGLVTTHAIDSMEQTDRALRRCLSLANSTHLAALNYLRRQP